MGIRKRRMELKGRIAESLEGYCSSQTEGGRVMMVVGMKECFDSYHSLFVTSMFPNSSAHHQFNRILHADRGRNFEYASKLLSQVFNSFLVISTTKISLAHLDLEYS